MTTRYSKRRSPKLESIATTYGHREDWVTILRAEDLIDTIDFDGKTPLHHAALKGNLRAVTQLLLASPKMIYDIDRTRRTALHFAAEMGHEKVAELLLTKAPSLFSAASETGWSPLCCAVGFGHQALAETMLAISSEEAVRRWDRADETLLHLAAKSPRLNEQFLIKLWQLYPEALVAVNRQGRTPFAVALYHGNDCMIDLFQWKLSLDDIACVCNKANDDPLKKPDLGNERFLPIIRLQCSPLFNASITQDVVDLMWEYLDFKRRSKGATNEQNESSDPAHAIIHT